MDDTLYNRIKEAKGTFLESIIDCGINIVLTEDDREQIRNEFVNYFRTTKELI